jgi:hypothetical protein
MGLNQFTKIPPVTEKKLVKAATWSNLFPSKGE